MPSEDSQTVTHQDRQCLVDDGDCVHGERLRRDLCDRHYGWLLRYGTTDKYRRTAPATEDGRATAELLAVERRLAACRLGEEPAETLPGFAREHLVHDLWSKHWTDRDIAAWTRMSTYTTGRIRERLGLPPNHAPGRAA